MPRQSRCTRIARQISPDFIRTLSTKSLSLLSGVFQRPTRRLPMPTPLKNSQDVKIATIAGFGHTGTHTASSRQHSSGPRFVTRLKHAWRSQTCLYLIFAFAFSAFMFTASVIEAPSSSRFITVESQEKVLILLYTSYKGQRDWGLGPGDALFKHLNCPIKACALTTDRGLMEDAPVVVYHIPELKTDLNPPPRSKNRPQSWVFYTHQSPAYSHQPPYLWQHLFNLSMTYHPGAEIHFPFGRIRKRSVDSPKDYLAVAKEERKMVAWLVDDCKSYSKREKYIERLKKAVPVDTYGECGDHECDDPDGCVEMIGKSYKFYLSFENSLCEEYVTREFYRHAMLDVVPIVRGGTNYSRQMPQNSFINTADFQTTEDLGRYLSFLASNPEEYAKYMEWKNYYSVDVTDDKDKSWCHLCDIAHDVTGVKTRQNPYEFWFQGKACWSPNDL